MIKSFSIIIHEFISCTLPSYNKRYSRNSYPTNLKTYLKSIQITTWSPSSSITFLYPKWVYNDRTKLIFMGIVTRPSNAKTTP